MEKRKFKIGFIGWTSSQSVKSCVSWFAEREEQPAMWRDIIDYQLYIKAAGIFINIFKKHDLNLSNFAGKLIKCKFPALMNWRQIIQWVDQGFEVSTHTGSHVTVSRLLEDQYQQELIDPKDEIESRLGVKVTAFASPYGDDRRYSEKALNTLKGAGYEHAFIVAGRSNDPFCLSRISIHKDDDIKTFKVKNSGTYDDFKYIYVKLKSVIEQGR